MNNYILTFDLGTGGSRASLYDENGDCVGSIFEEVNTRYSVTDCHEQRPDAWWEAIAASSRTLLKLVRSEVDFNPDHIACIGVGGHSLGTVPLDASGELLREWTPIWSDGRAFREANEFFSRMDSDTWYERTGAGVPSGNYPAFKLLWFKGHEPDLYSKIASVLGTKDYINYKLTGVLATDPSCAGNYGIWNLKEACYDQEILELLGLPRTFFPGVLPSTAIIGTLCAESARLMGLPAGIKVINGGVDNCCIALGARAWKSGRLAASLGSGSWVAVSSEQPQTNLQTRPFIYPHVVPGQFLCSVGVFATGTTLRWVKNELCRNIVMAAEASGRNPYFMLSKEARKSGIGAGGLIFNPCFGGPSTSNDPAGIRGTFWGLSLRHTQADVIRAVFEGIAMAVRVAFDDLKSLGPVEGPINVVGDTLSELLRNIYVHILNYPIYAGYKSVSVPSLGIAALAAVGAGFWEDFSPIEKINRNDEALITPDPGCAERYNQVYYLFKKAARFGAEMAREASSEIVIDEI
ncbi:MAG: FGGY family carbohydrate kinase [Planctomycetia bacterium]|nr:FGGY family carbohydrate kinase [Planctomycetia bacterium]